MSSNFNPAKIKDDETHFNYGFWFFFNFQGHEIVAFASAVTGKEKIYIDEEEVSNRRSFGLRSHHNFEINGAKLSIGFRVTGIFGQKVHCSLFEEEQLIIEKSKSLSSYAGKHHKLTWETLKSSFISGFFIGLIISLIVKLF